MESTGTILVGEVSTVTPRAPLICTTAPNPHAVAGWHLILQSQLLADQETNLTTIQTLKKAVTDQEVVITRLEKLFAAAVSRSKELEGWKTSAEAWEAEAARLRCAVRLAHAEVDHVFVAAHTVYTCPCRRVEHCLGLCGVHCNTPHEFSRCVRP